MEDFGSLEPHAVWRDDEPLECVSIIPEMPDTATFTFRAPSGALFAFLPGQFLTLELPVPGGPVYRTFTISSSPSRPRSLSITARAQGQSIGARWMLDHLQPGMRIKAVGPAGQFTCFGRPNAKYLFISAGSGITPMMSMTTFMFDLGDAPDIVFINCASRPSEIVFRERLEHMASRVPSINLKWVVSGPDPFRPWTGYEGHLNQLMLGLMAPDYLERDVYCCGPEPFMQAMRDALAGLGYDMSRYHQESFLVPAETPADVPELDDVVPEATSTASIHFAASGKTINCTETDTILGVARHERLGIPFGCTVGICGTCKVKKLAGEVHMVHNGGISEEDIAAGYILACCSHPIGLVEVDA